MKVLKIVFILFFILSGANFVDAALGDMGDPALSCLDLKTKEPAFTSGLYYLQSDSMTTPEQYYCDMDIDGGGWTLLFQRRGNNFNRESCGTDVNSFLHDTCGDLNNLGFTDSYSSDTDLTFSRFDHGEIAVVQYSNATTQDLDDAYILHTDQEIFPDDTTGLTEFNLNQICDINNANCDDTGAIWKYTGTSWYHSSLCNPNNYSGSLSYRGNYGYCHNGNVGGASSALFGNRDRYNETKLWGFSGSSRNFMERVLIREIPDATTLRITEVEYDTVQSGNDGSYEWIEIYNHGTEAANLENWTLTDANPTTVTLPELIIPGGAYVVLANNPTNLQVNYPAITANVDLSPTLGLSNSGDTLTLQDSAGNEIDFVAWEGASAGWNQEAASDAGESICRVDDDIDTDTPSDFIICTSPSPQSSDTTPPATPSIPDLTTDSGNNTTDNITNDDTPSFDVVCSEDTSTITIYEGTTVLGTVACSAVGTTSVTPSALADGVHNITYTETDQFNNESDPSPVLAVTIDKVAPTITAFSADTDGAFSVDMPNLEFAATDTGGSGVFGYEISIDGGAFSAQASPYNPTIAAAASHTVVVRVTDIAGNQSTSTIQFPPVVSITSPTTLSNAAITDGTITVTGPNNITSVTVSANASNVSCGALPAAAPVTCTFQVDTTGTVTASAEDTSGSTGFTTRDYTIETVFPSINFTDPVVAGPAQSDFVFVLTSDASGVASQGYILTTNTTCDAAVYATGTEVLFTSGTRIITQTDESNNGNYICARATDNAGNTTYTRSVHDFNIDVTPPSLSVDTPTNGSPVMGFTDPDVTSVTVTTPSGSSCTAGTVTGITGTTYACTLSPTPVDGESVTVTASDPVGNTTTVTESNAIDLMAPDAPVVTSNQNPITGTGTAGDTITMTTDSGAMCSATVQPDSTWECTLMPDPVPGENYSATATDPLGNISNPASGSIFKEEKKSGGSKRISQAKLNEIFGTPEPEVTPTPVVIEDTCSPTVLFTENMKQGDVDGKYSSWEGASITEIKKLQTYMNERNYRSGPIDGVFGPITGAATKRMQKALGAREDGRVGPITRSLVNDECTPTKKQTLFETLVEFLTN